MSYQYEDMRQMQQMFKEFGKTLETDRNEEWYASDYDVWLDMSERFIQWKFKEEIERAQRRALYFKLRDEFGDEPQEAAPDLSEALEEISSRAAIAKAKGEV